MQHELFHEDLNGALAHIISGLGGPKRVGHELWPSLSVDGAARKIHHCLNDQHQQDFKPAELLWLLKEARKKGIHSAMTFICSEAGYQEPIEMNPESESEKLQREFMRALEFQKQLAEKMERLANMRIG